MQNKTHSSQPQSSSGNTGTRYESQNNILYVTNFARELTIDYFNTLFGQFGKINDICVFASYKIVIPYAFIQFDDLRDAVAAKNKLHNKITNGLPLKVQYKRSKPIGKQFTNNQPYEDYYQGPPYAQYPRFSPDRSGAQSAPTNQHAQSSQPVKSLPVVQSSLEPNPKAYQNQNNSVFKITKVSEQSKVQSNQNKVNNSQKIQPNIQNPKNQEELSPIKNMQAKNLPKQQERKVQLLAKKPIITKKQVQIQKKNSNVAGNSLNTPTPAQVVNKIEAQQQSKINTIQSPQQAKLTPVKRENMIQSSLKNQIQHSKELNFKMNRERQDEKSRQRRFQKRPRQNSSRSSSSSSSSSSSQSYSSSYAARRPKPRQRNDRSISSDSRSRSNSNNSRSRSKSAYKRRQITYKEKDKKVNRSPQRSKQRQSYDSRNYKNTSRRHERQPYHYRQQERYHKSRGSPQRYQVPKKQYPEQSHISKNILPSPINPQSISSLQTYPEAGGQSRLNYTRPAQLKPMIGSLRNDLATFPSQPNPWQLQCQITDLYRVIDRLVSRVNILENHIQSRQLKNRFDPEDLRMRPQQSERSYQQTRSSPVSYF